VKRLLILLFCSILVLGNNNDIVCPPTTILDPSKIDFPYDPNKINYKLICVVKTRIGGQISLPVRACDPDGDFLVYGIQAGPLSMTIQPIDLNEARIEWTANEVGLHYVGISVHDVPPGGDIMYDYGSLLIMVYGTNKPPVFTGCNLF